MTTHSVNDLRPIRSPRGIPLLGHTPQIPGTNPFEDFAELSKPRDRDHSRRSRLTGPRLRLADRPSRHLVLELSSWPMMGRGARRPRFRAPRALPAS